MSNTNDNVVLATYVRSGKQDKPFVVQLLESRFVLLDCPFTLALQSLPAHSAAMRM